MRCSRGVTGPPLRAVRRCGPCAIHTEGPRSPRSTAFGWPRRSCRGGTAAALRHGPGPDQGSRTAAAVTRIRTAAPVVWGGDWNHELTGRLYAGSTDGRASIIGALDHLGLSAPTDASPHRLPGARTIDHVAVPAFWTVGSVERVSAVVDGMELSDHDAYVVTTD